MVLKKELIWLAMRQKNVITTEHRNKTQTNEKQNFINKNTKFQSYHNLPQQKNEENNKKKIYI